MRQENYRHKRHEKFHFTQEMQERIADLICGQKRGLVDRHFANSKRANLQKPNLIRKFSPFEISPVKRF